MFKVIHQLEEEFAANHQQRLFESFNSNQPALTSSNLLSTLLDYGLLHEGRWFCADMVAEDDCAIDWDGYKRIPKTAIYASDEMKMLFENLIQGNSKFFHTNRIGQVKHKGNHFSLLIEASPEKVDAVRLAAIMFFMPNDIIDYVIERLVIIPSKSTKSVYSNRKNSIRISDHWGNSRSCQITNDSPLVANGVWCVGELVNKKNNFNKIYQITKTSTESVSRSDSEKLKIIQRLQKEVFANEPHQIAALEDFAMELGFIEVWLEDFQNRVKNELEC